MIVQISYGPGAPVKDLSFYFGLDVGAPEGLSRGGMGCGSGGPWVPGVGGARTEALELI